jgi:hypothetical protein
MFFVLKIASDPRACDSLPLTVVVGVWNIQLSTPTNVYLKIQMFVSKAKTN